MDVLGWDSSLPDNTLRAIGRVTVRWSAIEFTMQAVAWHLLDVDRIKGLAVTAHLTLPRLTDLVLTLIDHVYGHGEKWERASALLRRVGAAGIERNNIVHAVWIGRGLNGLAEAMTHKARGKLQRGHIFLSAKEIDAVADRILRLERELVLFLHELNLDEARRLHALGKSKADQGRQA